MNKRLILHIGVIIVLVTFLVASIIYTINHFAKANKEREEFKRLEDIVTINNNNNEGDTLSSSDEDSQSENKNDKNENIDNENSKTTNYSSIDLSSLKIKNNDIVGWIKIDGTNISYPVMQNGNYYLKRNFYKRYSEYGTPFLQENCDVKESDNLVTYGHHMNNKTMYSAIDNYKSYDFYINHRYIKFYTIEDGKTKEDIYEVCFAFKTVSTGEGYKYYSYTNFYDIDEYNEFVSGCRNIQLYDTEVQTEYGDKFITMSTCEYSQKNGRMVVVGRKV